MPLFFAVFPAHGLYALARVAERSDSARVGRQPQDDRECVARDLTVGRSSRAPAAAAVAGVATCCCLSA